MSGPNNDMGADAKSARVDHDTSCNPARMVLTGVLDCNTTAGVWKSATNLVDETPAQQLVLDASGVTYLDGFGAALLLDIQRRAIRRKIAITLTGLREDFQGLLAPLNVESYVPVPPVPKGGSLIESLGGGLREVVADMGDFVEFTGEISRALVFAAFNPRTVRWKDVIQTAVVAGADAIPLILLVGFLIGFVMAFQAAIPMRQFGADVFLPTLVGVAMLRELGPIMTALGLAGRSGAAFSAEIGTMKVNEEVSALITLGLAPVRFLLVPRIIAAVAVTPFLIVFANIAGLVGGLLVFMAIGYPARLYMDQLQQTIGMNDLLGGMFKGFAFGFLVAAVGCMRGLQTTTGASAVGRSTTSAVVTSIVLVAIGDGLFAVVYYYLGI